MDEGVLREYLKAHRKRIISEWKDLLRFPSISAEPDHAGDCAACATWLAEHLAAMGFSARLLATQSKPVVFAERQGTPGRPTILLYGHYDVQPVDPVEKWVTHPFEPELRGNRIFARGAVDDKGQFFYVLKAIEALSTAGESLPTIKILLEGEEECGSRGISAALPVWKDLLKADVLMVCDTGMASQGVPALIAGLRGIINLTVTLSGSHHDLHSGSHGGVAPNAATAMAHLLASLHRTDGSVAVRDFYKSITEPSATERELVNAAPFSPEDYAQKTGVPPIAGELDFTPAERVAFRPALDINGMHSGYGGPGSKTIIPATATAKISARLVAGQDPQKVMDAIVRHLNTHAPKGLKMDLTEVHVAGPALRTSIESPVARLAAKVLEELFAVTPMFKWEGASIPILSQLALVSGAEPLLVGMGLDEDNIHAPNESFSLEQFEKGFLYAGLLLSRI